MRMVMEEMHKNLGDEWTDDVLSGGELDVQTEAVGKKTRKSI
jgi:hypothetical protein